MKYGRYTWLLMLIAIVMIVSGCAEMAPSIGEKWPAVDPVTTPVSDKHDSRLLDEREPDLPEDLPAPDIEFSKESAVADPEYARSSTGKTSIAGASPAVVELLQNAQSQAQAGHADTAAATLERAIRIEPENPWLWHRLAVSRLQQSNWEQARELASRSNALAQGHTRLLAGNWLIIAYAFEGQGNHVEAERARASSEAYFGRAGSSGN